MTINNPELYIKSLWDWSILDGCFGNTIKPTDIDGFVERNGRFLVIETKLPGALIPQGQMITFRALAKTTLFTIIVVWGEPGTPQHVKLMTRRGEGKKRYCDLDGLRDLCSKWFDYANGAF